MGGIGKEFPNAEKEAFPITPNPDASDDSSLPFSSSLPPLPPPAVAASRSAIGLYLLEGDL